MSVVGGEESGTGVPGGGVLVESGCALVSMRFRIKETLLESF